MGHHSKQTLAKEGRTTPAQPLIPATVTLIVIVIAMVLTQHYSKQTLAGVCITAPVLPVRWESGAVTRLRGSLLPDTTEAGLLPSLVISMACYSRSKLR